MINGDLINLHRIIGTRLQSLSVYMDAMLKDERYSTP